MSLITASTAILVFSRSAEEEASVKTFHHGQGPQADLWVARQLIAHTLATVRQTGLPVYQARRQTGASFGERLANALEEVFQHGHQRVIIVGNDSPGLNLRLLQEANQALQEQSMVIGPATDGGSYLIGLSRYAYQRTAFVQLAWETAQLCDDLRAYSMALQQSTHQLPLLSDIDSAQDLQRVWRQLPQWHRFRIKVRARFQPSRKPSTIFRSPRLLPELAALALRGPPALNSRMRIGG
jgi:glycosyltransferase A (GT-A) superfamily protein (DUF2064 family)